MSNAMAHSSTDRMRWRTARAVSALLCQIGVRISSTSAVLTSETGRLPMRGKAYRSMLRIQFCACHRPRQPSRFCSSTRWAASAKVGTPWTRRLSARGSPPDRASMRLARASSRALASGTSVAAPSPSSRRRPRMTSRWTQLRVPVGWTNRYKPLPSACRPGGAERTKAAESALSGWRPRRLVLRGVAAGLATTSIPPLYTGLGWIPPYVLTRLTRVSES